MAAHERLSLQTSIAHHILTSRLAQVLPNGATFKLYHVSTPPSRTSALYSAPPGERPDRTYLESHFLAVSINTSSISVPDKPQQLHELLVYGIEVLIYSTAYSTTFFVSKADSTGYLKLLNLPKSSPSPLKDISSTFLSCLIERRKRPSIRSVISLFARAQGQYLFPGSSDNEGKHVLDDRNLIRWWCRVLHPVVETANDSPYKESRSAEAWRCVRGYIIVPGLDDHDVKSFIPRTKGTSAGSLWTVGHPLRDLSRHQGNIPPRCLVPHFPDDPKSRFLDELDDELSTSRGKSISGEWRSVKTLDQFWEMMAYRQECSAGRLVGFIWVVFEPYSPLQPEDSASPGSQSSVMSLVSDATDDNNTLQDLPAFPHVSLTPNSSLKASSRLAPTSSPFKPGESESNLLQQSTTKSSPRKKRKLSGPIIPRQPRIKTCNRVYALERPEKTAYYVWPPDNRGQVVLDEKDYTRVTELLLRLDFTNLERALASTGRWINEVRSGPSSSASNGWGASVTGTKVFESKSESGKLGVTTLNMGLVRKKRKVAADEGNGAKNM